MDTKERKKPATPKNGKAETKRPAPKKAGKAPKRSIPVRKNDSAKQRERTDREPTPDVVYTEPGVFNRNRLILRIITVVAVVLALIFGISIFFKVETVTVAGNVKYTAGEVLEASGIRTGDSLFGLNDAQISSNIIAKLPYVARVRVGIKLPSTVKLVIEELDVAYSIEADDGSWWLIRADGLVVDKTSSAEADLYTKIRGVKLTKPVAGQKAVAAQPTGEGQQITVKAEEQLNVAISLIRYLEKYGMLSGVASLDVSSLTALEIWYGTRFQIKLGDTTGLETKVSNMKKAINSMSETETGILDVSATNSEGKFSCIPFPS